MREKTQQTTMGIWASHSSIPLALFRSVLNAPAASITCIHQHMHNRRDGADTRYSPIPSATPPPLPILIMLLNNLDNIIIRHPPPLLDNNTPTPRPLRRGRPPLLNNHTPPPLRTHPRTPTHLPHTSPLPTPLPVTIPSRAPYDDFLLARHRHCGPRFVALCQSE